MDLCTKNGRPLQVSGGAVYSRSGTVIGRIKGEKVYSTDGRYIGTITGGRLVYRSTDSATIGSPSRQQTAPGSQGRIAPGQQFGAMNRIFQIE